jgi:hypothetical protein
MATGTECNSFNLIDMTIGTEWNTFNLIEIATGAKHELVPDSFVQLSQTVNNSSNSLIEFD